MKRITLRRKQEEREEGRGKSFVSANSSSPKKDQKTSDAEKPKTGLTGEAKARGSKSPESIGVGDAEIDATADTKCKPLIKELEGELASMRVKKEEREKTSSRRPGLAKAWAQRVTMNSLEEVKRSSSEKQIGLAAENNVAGQAPQNPWALPELQETAPAVKNVALPKKTGSAPQTPKAKTPKATAPPPTPNDADEFETSEEARARGQGRSSSKPPSAPALKKWEKADWEEDERETLKEARARRRGRSSSKSSSSAPDAKMEQAVHDFTAEVAQEVCAEESEQYLSEIDQIIAANDDPDGKVEKANQNVDEHKAEKKGNNKVEEQSKEQLNGNNPFSPFNDGDGDEPMLWGPGGEPPDFGDTDEIPPPGFTRDDIPPPGFTANDEKTGETDAMATATPTTQQPQKSLKAVLHEDKESLITALEGRVSVAEEALKKAVAEAKSESVELGDMRRRAEEAETCRRSADRERDENDAELLKLRCDAKQSDVDHHTLEQQLEKEKEVHDKRRKELEKSLAFQSGLMAELEEKKLGLAAENKVAGQWKAFAADLEREIIASKQALSEKDEDPSKSKQTLSERDDDLNKCIAREGAELKKLEELEVSLQCSESEKQKPIANGEQLEKEKEAHDGVVKERDAAVEERNDLQKRPDAVMELIGGKPSEA